MRTKRMNQGCQEDGDPGSEKNQKQNG